MNIPRYWAKGETTKNVWMRNPATGQSLGTFSCWGWSHISREDALAEGRRRADAVAAKILGGNKPDRYAYGDRPLREQIMDTWTNGDGDTIAMITRNAYGCEIINTSNIMFVDIDFPAQSRWSIATTLLRSLFRGRHHSADHDPEATAMARIRTMIEADSRCGVRIYRTRRGLRYLMTHATASPNADITLGAMSALGADPLYIRLCKVQQCFRARLTPKPWRCGSQALRIPYPWQNASVERDVQKWVSQYAKKADGFATCSLIDHMGHTSMSPDITRVVRYHDDVTKADSNLPLA